MNKINTAAISVLEYSNKPRKVNTDWIKSTEQYLGVFSREMFNAILNDMLTIRTFAQHSGVWAHCSHKQSDLKSASHMLQQFLHHTSPVPPKKRNYFINFSEKKSKQEQTAKSKTNPCMSRQIRISERWFLVRTAVIRVLCISSQSSTSF